MNRSAEIVVLDARGVEQAAGELADVLIDCVEGGASISFMLPFSHREAFAYFWKLAVSVEDRQTVLLAARRDGRVVGTVQLGLDTPPNQPHRADVRKMLVHRDTRKQGIGALLLARAEDEARRLGRTLLVLDTVRGGAGERLYDRGGWTRAGIIPEYALFPNGGFCDTVVFWKKLA